MAGAPLLSVLVVSHRPQYRPVAEASVDAQTLERLAPGSVQLLTSAHARPFVGKVNGPMRAAVGKYVTTLCDDDALAPTFGEETVELAERFGADIVYTARSLFRDDTPDPTAGEWHVDGTTSELIPAEALVPGFLAAIQLGRRRFTFGVTIPQTALIRRSLWEKLGGWDESLDECDTEFLFRAFEARARVWFLNRPLFCYRLHAGQQSKERPLDPRAKRQFHRKHFAKFGVTFAGSMWTDGQTIVCREVPPQDRLAFAAVHHTPLTTLGYMATERRQLTQTAKTAIEVTRDLAAKSVDQVIGQALADAGCPPEDGWKLNEDMEAVRESAQDGPALVLEGAAKPATQATGTGGA